MKGKDKGTLLSPSSLCSIHSCPPSVAYSSALGSPQHGVQFRNLFFYHSFISNQNHSDSIS
jgi:hypothetical protein